MIKKVPSQKLGMSEPNPRWFGNKENDSSNPFWSNDNWLKSRFHFSFAEYNNPSNQNFGVLRVMNDDLVQPARGFGGHPHSNVEICTYVCEGSLTHADSMGTEETLTRGAIQFMTAGTGVQHQEHNRSEKEPLRFIQMWITTRKRGLTPNYGSSCGDEAGRRNQWSHLVSDVADKSTSTPVEINQDANIYVSETEVGKPVEFELKAGRQAYFLCMEGNVDIGAKDKLSLMRHDAAEITGPQTICVTPKPDAENSPKAHFLLVEMKFVAGDGRTDL